MWIKSIGIIVVGLIIGRLAHKDPILGLVLAVGLVCIVIGDWIERNKLIKKFYGK